MTYTQKVNQTRFYFNTEDILKEKADALICWTLGDLRRGDELFLRMHNEGGSVIQKDCLSYLMGNSEIPIGEVISTGAGILPYRTIFHCVIPFKSESPSKDGSLTNCFTRVGTLIKFNPTPIRTLSLSPVPEMIYGDYTENTIRDTITALLAMAAKTKLREIKLITPDEEFLKLFLEEFKKQSTTPWERFLIKIGF